MAADDRLIEIMAELLAEVHQMRVDNNERLDKTNERLDKTNERLDRLETQTAENNAAIGELRVSVMRLADKIEEIYHLDQRVRVLENIVLPKPPLQAA
ncbi:hypothetical protein A0257_18870 [Hymenobacter psoromatis]|nr:hypothetical protein A0257_18870 [Hymenobacter psoromatis]